MALFATAESTAGTAAAFYANQSTAGTAAAFYANQSSAIVSAEVAIIANHSNINGADHIVAGVECICILADESSTEIAIWTDESSTEVAIRADEAMADESRAEAILVGIAIGIFFLTFMVCFGGKHRRIPKERCHHYHLVK